MFIALNDVEHENAYVKIIDELLDDKKLIDVSNRVVSHSVYQDGKIADNKEEFSRRFIICLLRKRYLFDKYIQGLEIRHAKLAVGSSITFVDFIWNTYEANK